MTVEKLVEELKKFPKDARVEAYDADAGLYDITELELRIQLKNDYLPEMRFVKLS